jgi:excisionase family DNA binding protein
MDIREKKYKVPEAAEFLGISEKTLWSKIGGARIAVYRIGRCVRIGESELIRVLEEGFTPAQRAA